MRTLADSHLFIVLKRCLFYHIGIHLQLALCFWIFIPFTYCSICKMTKILSNIRCLNEYGFFKIGDNILDSSLFSICNSSTQKVFTWCIDNLSHRQITKSLTIIIECSDGIRNSSTRIWFHSICYKLNLIHYRFVLI
jgi:hypothetical protein